MKISEIVILDDDVKFATALKEKIELHFGRPIKVFREYNKEKLESMNIELLFLDIEMGIVNGIDVAKEIQKWENNPIIIFVSNNNGFIHDSLEAQPLYFIRKTHFEEDLKRAYSLLEDISFHDTDTIDVCGQNIKIGGILYVESSNHKITFMLAKGKVECRVTLNEVANMLGGHYFSRVHRSYIVNLREVDSHSSTRVNLKNGRQLDIGRKYYTKFKEEYKEAKLNGII